jgi:hypothetical protein
VGDKDEKLKKAVEMVKDLLKDGFALFCFVASFLPRNMWLINYASDCRRAWKSFR